MTASTSPSPGMRGGALNIGLWIAQWLFAASFVGAALMKLAMPIAQLATIWPWTGELAPTLIRLLGIIDLLGGLGVLLPSLTRIKPRLTVVAAIASIALQLCAMAFHASRDELAALPVNIVFIATAIFIAWGRWSRHPLYPKA